MHTIQLPDGWSANVHGDFSGDVYLVPPHGAAQAFVPVPMRVLVALVAEAIRRKRLVEIEGSSDRKILGVSGGHDGIWGP